MTVSAAPYNNSMHYTQSKPVRMWALLFIALWLIAQLVVGWHTANHVIHDDSHCNVCTFAAHLNHAVVADPLLIVGIVTCIAILYAIRFTHENLFASRTFYDAQGPPAAR